MRVPQAQFEDREPIPESLYLGGIYSIIEIGTQSSPDPRYKDNRQVIFTWELPSIMETWNEGEPERPASISAFYNFVIAQTKAGVKSKLLKLIESLAYRSLTHEEQVNFDTDRLLGVWGQLQVIHHINTAGIKKAKVDNVMPIMKGTPVPNLINPQITWSIDNLSHPRDVEALAVPDWIKKLIRSSHEFQAMSGIRSGHTDRQSPEDADTDDAPWD